MNELIPPYGTWGSTYGLLDETLTGLNDAAKTQINLANAGRTLPKGDYRRAEGQNKVMVPSVTTAHAYLKSAYWLAVAARITGNRNLRNAAEDFRKSGETRASFFGIAASKDPADIQSVHQQAANLVRRYARGAFAGHSSIKAIQTLLTTTGEPERVVSRQQYTEEHKPTITEVPMESAKDVAEFLERMPDPTKEKPWWFWPVVIGGGGLLLVTILGVATRPHVAAAREVYRDYRR